VIKILNYSRGSMSEKPKVSHSLAQKELDNAEKQFDKFDADVKELTLDRMRAAPKHESEPITTHSDRELKKTADLYLKPSRSINNHQKFNEKFRSAYEFDKEYVCFIADHKESPGDKIEVWTRKYGGTPAEFWEVPTGKPVFGPRYLAEQIASCSYHRLKTEDSIMTGGDQNMRYHGSLVVDTTVQRLNATPHNKTRTSVFGGAF